jgi:hypothetical protein
VNTFDELITGHDSGTLNTELTREMRELIESLSERAQQTGTAKGEICLKLTFEAIGGGRIQISSGTTIKRPGPPRTSETRWIGNSGTIAAEDPRQTKLPLKTVKNDPTPIR